ncbi:MAG: lysophospholipid acyltransferase family protein [Planctomycetota bacterium]
MARDKSPLMIWGEYLGVRAATGLMTCFPTDQNLSTAGAIGSMFAKFNARRTARAAHNIALSFPEMADAEVVDLAERSMRYMFQMFLVDPFVMPRLITPNNWANHLVIGDLGEAVEKLIRREPALFITGHCGNWELLGYSLAVLGYPIAAVARPLDNPKLNDWLMGVREATGLRIITKFGATTELEETLDRGGQIGFIADQNAGDQGMFVPFFGRLASSYKSIGLLAMRYEVPVIAGFARRVDQTFRYELSCHDVITPEDWADQPDPLYYITARYNRAIESMIRSAPEQYLWLHRRWKSRPKHERQGKVMPKRLREKLESLPWMTDDEMTRIVHHSEVSSKRYAAEALA